MALKVNGGRLHTHVNRVFGGNAVSGIYGLGTNALRKDRGIGVTINFDSGEHAVSGTTNKASKSAGARHPVAFKMPTKAGSLSAHNQSEGVATASLSLASGRNIAATADGVATASATLQLVVSMVATSDGVATVSGNVVASLAFAGTSDGSSSTTASITAIAWGYGTASGEATAAMVSYATGSLAGSISPFTDLSPQNLAQYVIEYAEASPIHADIRKVNSYTVDGDGQSGTEWGPA